MDEFDHSSNDIDEPSQNMRSIKHYSESSQCTICYNLYFYKKITDAQHFFFEFAPFRRFMNEPVCLYKVAGKVDRVNRFIARNDGYENFFAHFAVSLSFHVNKLLD